MSNDNYGNKWANNKWANPKWGGNSQPFTPPFLPDTYAKKYADKYGTIRNYVPDSVLKYYDQAVANLKGLRENEEELEEKKGYKIIWNDDKSQATIQSIIWLYAYDFDEYDGHPVGQANLLDDKVINYMITNIKQVYERPKNNPTVENPSITFDISVRLGNHAKYTFFVGGKNFGDSKKALKSFMNKDTNALRKKIEHEKDDDVKDRLQEELLRIDLGCCAFLVGRTSMGRISEVHGIGNRVGYFNIEDIRPTDIDNTPAHEFGHIMGIADRYHFYMRVRSKGTSGLPKLYVIPLQANDNLEEVKGPLNNEWESKKGYIQEFSWHVQIPMYLPESYDPDYETANNLFSSASPTITELQISFVLGMEKVEHLPKGYEKITFFGIYDFQNPTTDWNKSNPLYVGEVKRNGKIYIVARSSKRKKGATLTDENTDKLAQEHIWAWGHPAFESRPRSKRFSEDKEAENRVTFEDFYKVENDTSINTFLIELPYE